MVVPVDGVIITMTAMGMTTATTLLHREILRAGAKSTS